MYKIDSCQNCDFFPFCATEASQSLWLKKVNSVVKQQFTLKKKQIVPFPQKAFQNLYVIKSGGIKTYEIDNQGKELIRGFYFTGEVLGFEAIAKGRYLLKAMTLSQTEICEISYQHFIDLLGSNTSLQKQILSLMSKQLTVNFYLNYITAEQRLACFLIDLSLRLPAKNKCKEFFLPMSRQDIGNYLKLSGETISRLFTRFKKNKLISVEQKKIQILNLEQLQLIADQIT